MPFSLVPALLRNINDCHNPKRTILIFTYCCMALVITSTDDGQGFIPSPSSLQGNVVASGGRPYVIRHSTSIAGRYSFVENWTVEFLEAVLFYRCPSFVFKMALSAYATVEQGELNEQMSCVDSTSKDVPYLRGISDVPPFADRSAQSLEGCTWS